MNATSDTGKPIVNLIFAIHHVIHCSGIGSPENKQILDLSVFAVMMWHTPHGINLLYAPKSSCNYYLLYEQPSLVKLLLMSIHFFITANDF